MKKLLALALCVVSCSASAELYRCVQNDKVLITGEPCPYGAKSTVIVPDAAPQESAEISPTEELARLKQKVAELEQARLAHNKVYADAEAATRKEAAQAAQREAEQRAQEEAVAERKRSIVADGWSHAKWPFYPPPGKAPRHQDNAPLPRPQGIAQGNQEDCGVKTGVRNSLNSNPGSRNRPVVPRMEEAQGVFIRR
ncbi:MAG: hypothetical protein LBS89_02155 [Zoogloeaceae bacterium]|nr:hypothetical protein [Zoogloeaceae bacterium]